MESGTGNAKDIFKDIFVNKATLKSEREIDFFTDKQVKSYKVEELIDDVCVDSTFVSIVSKNYKKVFEETYQKEISPQQIKFGDDVTKLLCGNLKENRPVLVPARAGFGKSTIIKTFLEAKVFQMKVMGILWGAIIVTDRISDLKELQESIREQFGYYKEYYYNDKSGKEQFRQVDWIYTLESWNRNVCRNDDITKYDENNCTKSECKYFQQCKVPKQIQEQEYSPIVAMTNVRLFNYLSNNRLEHFTSWKYSSKVTSKREVMIIDEKPKLENNDQIDTSIIDEMLNNIKSITGRNISTVKNVLEKELLDVKSRLTDLERDNFEYRNTILINNQENVFSSEFKEYWNKYYIFKHRNKIATIETLLSKGGLWCKTQKKNYFKLVEYSDCDWSGIKTIIFDATSETDPSYKNIFNYLNIDDYKCYNHLHFKIIDENISKSALKEDPTKIDVISEWIKNDIAGLGKLYVVTYMEYSERVYKNLHEVSGIVYDTKDGKDIIPYFNNTRGKNLWQDCDYMIYLGWNRYPSDEYIASYLSCNFPFEHIREKYFSGGEQERFEIEKFLPKFIQNTKGVFDEYKIEFHKLCKIMTELEQEIFRTKVRDFGTDEDVTIYLFQSDKRLLEMIKQRFLGCDTEYVNVHDFKIHKMERRKDNEDNKELKLYHWLMDWNGESKNIKELKQELNISDDYWKKIKCAPLIVGIWENKSIVVDRIGKQYFISAKE